MATEAPFPAMYAAARDRFLTAARERGAAVETVTLPELRGAAGEALHTDVAVVATAGASRALVLVSGTHGAEGPAGSAIQHAVLTGAVPVPPDTDLVAVHALNPFGFSHRRRVNEDNVDVNRNFVEHAAAPVNAGYDLVHPSLVPDDWEGPAHRRAEQALLEHAGRLGLRAVQAAITGGQYLHPDGLFYGGDRPTWSNRTWRRLVREHLRGYTEIAYLDLHTGLGERGRVEPIFRGGRDAGALDRARRWYGPGLTRSEDGTSSSTPIGGNTAHALAEELPAGTVLTAITAEFGTQEPLLVLRALQADNWVWQRGSAAAAGQQEAIARLMAEAFDPPDLRWRSAVVAEGVRVVGLAARGLVSARDHITETDI